jgi:hypothetical protein
MPMDDSGAAQKGDRAEKGEKAASNRFDLALGCVVLSMVANNAPACP